MTERLVSIAAIAFLAWVPADSAPLAPLVEGLGAYSYPVSGCSDRAQSFFDQGLRLLHGFHYPESLASFREASRLSAECPMTYWGQAMAIAPGPNSRYTDTPDDPQGAGAEAIGRAMRRIEQASDKERGLIEALDVFYDRASEPQTSLRDRAYAEKMRELYERYPDDPEIATLYGEALMTERPWSYWTPDGYPRPGTLDALAAFHRALELSPDHPGANHLFIHVVEASQDPELALPHAERLARLMPSCGHVVHMPTHIYIRTGRYAEAVEGNRRSIAADREFLVAWGDHEIPRGVTTYGLSATTHHVHAEEFLYLAAVLEGNYAAAIASARSVSREMQAMLAGNGKAQRRFVRPYLTYRRFGKWDEMLAEPAPSDGLPFVAGIWHFGRGGAFVGSGELGDAERELVAVREAAATEGMDELLTRVNPARTLLTLAGDLLEAELAAARGRFDRAIPLLDTAVRIEDGLRYMEPPDWYQARLTLGRVLLEAGRPAEAETVYWEDLRRFPETGWALHGAWQALLRQGETERATEVERRFRTAWAGADVALDRAQTVASPRPGP